MSQSSNVKRSHRWVLLAAVPVLPFLLGAAFLQFFAPPYLFNELEALVPVENASLEREADPGASKSSFSHLGDRLTLAAAIFLQLTTCLCVVFFQFRRFRELESERRGVALRAMVISAGLAIGGLVLIWVTQAAPYQLTYDVPRKLLLKFPRWPWWFAADGDQGIFGQSRMFFSALVPFLAGAAVVILVSAQELVSALPKVEVDSDWENAFAKRVTELRNTFKLSSLVLVLSTVTLMLFVQLPSGLLDESAGKAYSAFALGLTMFWGTVMTLTLLVCFAPPALAHHREAIRWHAQSESEQDFAAWLEKREYFSFKRQMGSLATMLAPVLVGPAGMLLQTVLGG